MRGEILTQSSGELCTTFVEVLYIMRSAMRGSLDLSHQGLLTIIIAQSFYRTKYYACKSRKNKRFFEEKLRIMRRTGKVDQDFPVPDMTGMSRYSCARPLMPSGGYRDCYILSLS